MFKILITKLNINNSKNLNNFFEIFNNLKFIDLFEKIKPISKKYFNKLNNDSILEGGKYFNLTEEDINDEADPI